MADTDILNSNFNILLKKKKYSDALTMVTEWEKEKDLSTGRISGKLLLLLSKTYYFNNRYKKSKEYLELYETQHPELWFNKLYIEQKYRLLILEERADQSIELIERALEIEHPESEKYWLFFYLGKAYFWNGDYLKANRYFQKCYIYYLECNNEYMLALTMYMMGYLCFQRAVFNKAEDHFRESLVIFENADKTQQIGHCHKMFSLIYTRTGRYEEAKNELKMAIRKYNKLGSDSNILHCNIAEAYIGIFEGDYKLCERELKETYKEAARLNYKRAQALSAEFLGQVYYRRNKYREAESWLSKALKLTDHFSRCGDVAVEIYRSLGDVKIALGTLDDAEEMLSKAYKLCGHLGDKYELGSVYRAKALLALRRGDFDQGRSFFEESIITHSSINDKFELAYTYKIAAAEYMEWAKGESVSFGVKKRLFGEAKSYSLNAMRLYSSIKLGNHAQHCRDLFQNIENESNEGFKESRYKQIIFNPSWLYGDVLIARSRHMKDVVNRIKTIAAENIEVFIEGETGTGKEVVAQLLHKWSNRSEGPFIAVNCASVANELFESEFFGHAHGAFTGAVRRKAGYIKSAEGGTLFLDEISELTRSQQAKLLRVLQESKLRVVGETEETDIDIRLILASNVKIDKLLNNKLLREDFYYRVCSEIIRLKPLRERPDDIAALFAYYLNSENNEILAERDLIKFLNNYLWPGNVRELIKVVKSISIRNGNIHVVTLDDLPVWIRDSNQHYSLDKKTLIKNTLRRCEGNKTAAARGLGVSRSTLYRWIEELKS